MPLPAVIRFNFSLRSHSRRKGRRFWQWMIATLTAVFISYIPLRLAIAYLQAPTPQAIFMLGGRAAREEFTAEFSKTRPNLTIWISSGMAPEEARLLFQEAGVEPSRVNFDLRATDTVTNFTTMVEVFQQQHVHHVYLITSDFHMRRAIAIALVVFGSRGIAFTPVVVPSYAPTESTARVARDVVRSLCWLVTRRTGASLRYSSLPLSTL